MLTLAPIRLIAMNTDAGALHGHHQIYRESLKQDIMTKNHVGNIYEQIQREAHTSIPGHHNPCGLMHF